MAIRRFIGGIKLGPNREGPVTSDMRFSYTEDLKEFCEFVVEDSDLEPRHGRFDVSGLELRFTDERENDQIKQPGFDYEKICSIVDLAKLYFPHVALHGSEHIIEVLKQMVANGQDVNKFLSQFSHIVGHVDKHDALWRKSPQQGFNLAMEFKPQVQDSILLENNEEHKYKFVAEWLARVGELRAEESLDERVGCFDFPHLLKALHTRDKNNDWYDTMKRYVPKTEGPWGFCGLRERDAIEKMAKTIRHIHVHGIRSTGEDEGEYKDHLPLTVNRVTSAVDLALVAAILMHAHPNSYATELKRKFMTNHPSPTPELRNVKETMYFFERQLPKYADLIAYTDRPFEGNYKRRRR